MKATEGLRVLGQDPLWVVLLEAVIVFVVPLLLTLFNIHQIAQRRCWGPTGRGGPSVGSPAVVPG